MLKLHISPRTFVVNIKSPRATHHTIVPPTEELQQQQQQQQQQLICIPIYIDGIA